MKLGEIIGIVAGILAIIKFGRDFVNWLKKRGTESSESPSRKDKFAGVALSILCAAIWSISYTSLSFAAPKTDPWEMNVGLVGVATVIFFLLACLHAPLSKLIVPLSQTQTIPDRSPDVLQWNRLGPWLILVGNVTHFLFFIFALYYISASHTITLQKANPIFAAFLGVIFLKRMIPFSSWVTVFLVVVGVFIVNCDLSPTSIQIRTGEELKGSLFALAAGFSFALFCIGLEKVGVDYVRYAERLRVFAVIFFFSYVAILSFAYYVGSAPRLDSLAIWVLLFNGIRIAVVYLLFWAAIERIGALPTLVFVSIEVPLTMLWDHIWLGVFPPFNLMIGALIIMAGGLALTVQREEGSSE